jgi:hypothetical protein
MNETLLTLAEIDRAVEAIRSRSELKPEIGMILGSGLGGLADSIGIWNALSVVGGLLMISLLAVFMADRIK